MSILVKILGILDWSFKNLDFAQTFQIIKFCEKIVVHYLDFVKIFENLDFGQNS